MQSVAHGDLDAMTILFDRYHEWIYNFFFKMKPDAAFCEDLTQNVFYKALRYRSSYSGGKFASWIFTIARNLFHDHIEKEKHRSNVPVEQLAIVDEDGKDDRTDEVKRLHLVLNKLKKEEKELIVMSRFQGMKYQQIAEVIGSNETAVKTRVHRVIKKMKTLYFENQLS
ncbi:RNA polymerase sigma factor [Aureisphaera galaxeae]|nr:RNA polymerase sigma factor [Aureisphaera galaxeae]